MPRKVVFAFGIVIGAILVVWLYVPRVVAQKGQEAFEFGYNVKAAEEQHAGIPSVFVVIQPGQEVFFDNLPIPWVEGPYNYPFKVEVTNSATMQIFIPHLGGWFRNNQEIIISHLETGERFSIGYFQITKVEESPNLIILAWLYPELVPIP